MDYPGLVGSVKSPIDWILAGYLLVVSAENC